MSNTDGPWAKWTKEDWDNATYCPECGLPMLCLEPKEVDNGSGTGVGIMQCPYCTWLEDQSIIFGQEKQKLQDIIYEKDELLEKIYNWCKAYPLEIAPEPTKEDWKRANAILGNHGISMTQLTISNMRHVVDGISKIIKGDE